ncbi:MAG TPA: hypothetical protein VN953_01090 [Gemmatimonadales bacterium]|nr:hypothetical protein [Gemmatimonadales bacterium]
MDKYKELYDFAREAVAQSEVRFDAVDAKASTYLSVFTVLLGGAGFLVKWVADHLLPSHAWLDVLIVSLALPTAVLVAATWLSLLNVLKVHQIRVLPFDEATLQYFHANRLVDIHFNIARSLCEAWIVNQGVNERKLEKLTAAYRMMIVTLALILVVSVLYAVHTWNGGATVG